jgi:hypothetical protein
MSAGNGGALNPDFVEWLMGWPIKSTSLEPAISNELLKYKDRIDGYPESSPRKILLALRQAINTEKVRRQPNTGKYECLQKTEVLRPGMYGECDGEDGKDERCLATACPDIQKEELRDLRYTETLTNSSYRWEYPEQFLRQFDDALHSMSYEMALEEWEVTAEETFGLQNLWASCERSGFLSKTLSTLQEVWQSLNNEDKCWAAYLCVNNGGWWDLECPSISRVADGVAHRSNRLEALGNGQVPSVAAAAFRLLMTGA